ncbi:MAG TPA: helix-turn-helix domain-containing protein [Pseudonocardia sp.]
MERVYRSSRRAEQARRTRARILDAATAEFLERGYAGATMRAIAASACVSVPTVELGFGTKARLLKAAIDVAIAGDDDSVPVLHRSWTEAALGASTVEGFLDVAAEVVAAAQARSAGLVLAVFEGARSDPELATLAAQLTNQRAVTAGWLVDAMARSTPLRAESTRAEAVDEMWVLMEPALFDRLVRHRGLTPADYARWFARAARRLLVPDPTEERTP